MATALGRLRADGVAQQPRSLVSFSLQEFRVLEQAAIGAAKTLELKAAREAVGQLKSGGLSCILAVSGRRETGGRSPQRAGTRPCFSRRAR